MALMALDFSGEHSLMRGRRASISVSRPNQDGPVGRSQHTRRYGAGHPHAGEAAAQRPSRGTARPAPHATPRRRRPSGTPHRTCRRRRAARPAPHRPSSARGGRQAAARPRTAAARRNGLALDEASGRKGSARCAGAGRWAERRGGRAVRPRPAQPPQRSPADRSCSSRSLPFSSRSLRQPW